jgi:hypothetical protein
MFNDPCDRHSGERAAVPSSNQTLRAVVERLFPRSDANALAIAFWRSSKASRSSTSTARWKAVRPP